LANSTTWSCTGQDRPAVEAIDHGLLRQYSNGKMKYP